jgi:hydrogenase maturation protease
MTPMSIRIIGLGSDFGDDRVGFCAVDALGGHALPPHVTLHACGNPAADLLPLLAGTQHAILIDAVADEGQPGRVRQCAASELAHAGAASSHGVSVANMLTLAEALGVLPPTLTILGVTIDPQHDPHAADLSPPVRAALPALIEAVLTAATDEVTA